MSLLPFNTLPGPGFLFVEARLLGSPGQVISQIGLTMDAPNTSIAVFSRTSGVLLVAGVGSFFAYRVASNFLGNRFVWECLEASRYDRIPTADRRLLYALSEQDEEAEEDDDEARRLRVLRDADDSRSVRTPSQVSLSRLSRVRRSTRQSRGLLNSLSGTGTTSTRSAGIVSRESSRLIRSGSSVCSLSRVESSNSSVKSASLRIVWEGSQPAWDDFYGAGPSEPSGSAEPSVLSRLRHVASTSSVRGGAGREDMQSVGDLCSVFNDVMSVTSMVEGNDLLDDQFCDDMEDEGGGMWQKCLADSSKYMYQSVVVGQSENGSECGDEEAGSSRGVFGRHMMGSTLIPSTTMDSDADQMTRSNNSKRSTGRSMYDSAIGGEISSEDGSTCFDNSNRLYVLQESDNMSIGAPSCASLEWCEDEFSREQRKTFDDETAPRLHLRRANLDWDMESNRAASSIGSSSCIREVNIVHAPRSSRDLMVLACETFQPYSPPFKDIQSLYHKRRLKRVGLLTKTDSILELYIKSVLYHRASLLRDISWQTLEKRLETSHNDCDFLRKWPSMSYETMKRNLKLLHDLASDASQDVTSDHISGLELMMVLEAKRVYEEGLAGLFCDWFNLDSPAEVMRILTSTSHQLSQEVQWNLLCRISAVNIDVHDARRLSERAIVKRYSSPSPCSAVTMSWLQLGAQPAPLFYIPDEE